MHRVTVGGAEGAECAERRLKIRFDSFIETLSSLSDPDEKKVEEKLPGADLLTALAGQTDSFGAAVADVGEDAPLAERILAPTVPLSRHIFRPPTRFYKTGVVFLAYLNGHQDHFRMVGGLESARSVVHLSELFILANQAGLLFDPELATDRMSLVLLLAGIER